MVDLSAKLKAFKNKGNRENGDLFYEICDGVDKIFERGDEKDFGEISSKPLAAELLLSRKLFWLRTLPLEGMNLFTALHPEPAFCTSGRKERCSAGILGIWSGSEGSELASIEVRAGKNGAHLLYAAAEGLRNLAFAWHDIGEQAKAWKKSYPREWESAWQKADPFRDLHSKQARLIIIGNPAWIEENARGYLNLLPETIKIGKLHAEVSVYSVNGADRARVKPPALLPLKKIHPLKKHILDVMADIYSNRF